MTSKGLRVKELSANVYILVVDFGSSLLDYRRLSMIGCNHLIGHLVYVFNNVAVCCHVSQQCLQYMNEHNSYGGPPFSMECGILSRAAKFSYFCKILWNSVLTGDKHTNTAYISPVQANVEN